uniref:Putative secreted protein n=1 Tax=Anopheles darlingi TaxID=43151 RepID=A0A2M4DE58_ANODA
MFLLLSAFLALSHSIESYVDENSLHGHNRKYFSPIVFLAACRCIVKYMLYRRDDSSRLSLSAHMLNLTLFFISLRNCNCKTVAIVEGSVFFLTTKQAQDALRCFVEI